MSAPEFSRRLPLVRIRQGIEMEVAANAEECAALAERMGIPALAHLTCRFSLRPAPGRRYAAAGELRAEATQICVLSGEAFVVSVDEPFAVSFVPEGEEREELDLEAEDEVPYSGEAIDLGEAAAEQLALCLDPFPRKPGAVLPDGVASEDEG